MPRILQMIIFMSLAVVIFGGIHYYFYRRLVKNTQLKRPWRRIVIWAIVVLGISTFASFPLSRMLPLQVSRAVTFVPLIWMGLMVFLFDFLLLAEHGRLIVFLQRKVTKKAPIEPSVKLRLFRIVAIASTALTFGLGAVALGIGLSAPQVKRVEVKLERLDPEFDGFTIVQLTDLHIGPTLGREWLEGVVKQVNSLGPDVIVITGDFVDGSVERLDKEVAPLSKLKAKYGKFFVTGNHENFSGVEQWVKKVDELGLRVLSDEIVPITKKGTSLMIAGVNDFQGGHGGPEDTRDLSQILSNFDIKDDQEAILLMHNPRNMFGVNNPLIGLVLTGHTHGGQFWPFSYFVQIAHPYLSGMHDHGDRTQVYVNEGTGFWGPPLRLGTRGEITLLTLRSGRP